MRLFVIGSITYKCYNFGWHCLILLHLIQYLTVPKSHYAIELTRTRHYNDKDTKNVFLVFAMYLSIEYPLFVTIHFQRKGDREKT